MNEEKDRITQADEQADVLTAEPQKPPVNGAVRFVFDILEMFAWSVFVVLLLFTFAVRLCRVEGSSMENTLYEPQKLLIYGINYTPKQDDIVVFHLTQPEDNLEKTVVKRVIAVPISKTVEILLVFIKSYKNSADFGLIIGI